MFGLAFASIGAKQEPPAIRKDHWRVLFQSFVLSPNYSLEQNQVIDSLIGKIPGILASSLRELTEHVLSDEEKQGLRERAVENELYMQYREYKELVR